MNAKHPAVYNCAKRQIIKDLTAPPPNIRTAILALAFIIEAVHLGNLPGFMVASNKRNNQDENTRRTGTREQLIRNNTFAWRVWGWSHRYRRINCLNVAFFYQDFARLEAESVDLLLRYGLTARQLLNLSAQRG
ncbi:hypothetical protein C0995_009806 [Termitomyces sp. Mi166|nr:hypothetical protein C0995_009806 [Termitomyces sp. Mi166\